MLTQTPVKKLEASSANGRFVITASVTIELEYFTALKVALNPTTTTKGDKAVSFIDVTYKKQDGLKESDTQYVIREGVTWTARIDQTNLNTDTDALMGITYTLSNGTTQATTTSGDSNIVYDEANNCYIVSADVISMVPVVKTPLGIEVKSEDVTMISVADKIVKGGVGTIQLYAGEWTLVFGSSDKPSSASEAALKAFGKDSTSWTISQGSVTYTITVAETGTAGEFMLIVS